MFRFRGKVDVELYLKSPFGGSALCIQSQIESLFDSGVLSESDLIEMYNQKLAKRKTLKALGIVLPKKEKKQSRKYAIAFNGGLLLCDRKGIPTGVVVDCEVGKYNIIGATFDGSKDGKILLMR